MVFMEDFYRFPNSLPRKGILVTDDPEGIKGKNEPAVAFGLRFISVVWLTRARNVQFPINGDYH
jgi:hypothetical protein